MINNKCSCGFKFAGAGKYRNCEAFITSEGKGGIICPKCNKAYIDGMEVKLADRMDKRRAKVTPEVTYGT